MDSYYLEHHGVKGMRWGVRKENLTKLKNDSELGVKNRYKNPIKMAKQTAARAKLYDLDTESMVKGKKAVEKATIKFKRKLNRPAVGILGNEVSYGRAVTEKTLLYIGTFSITTKVMDSVAESLYNRYS